MGQHLICHFILSTRSLFSLLRSYATMGREVEERCIRLLGHGQQPVRLTVWDKGQGLDDGILGFLKRQLVFL